MEFFFFFFFSFMFGIFCENVGGVDVVENIWVRVRGIWDWNAGFGFDGLDLGRRGV